MKKVLAFITVLAALLCTACNNKQDNTSENPPVGDVTSATSADISENTGENTEKSEVSGENSVISQPAEELKHYTLDDFKEIKVNLNMQDSPPPVTFKEYDLSGIEFEAKKSPCKLPENVKIENICPYSERSANFEMEYEDYCRDFIEYYAPILEAEEKPAILYTAFDGENLYYLGDYDNACPSTSHHFEIFKYNPKTGENVSIYEYSDGTEGVAIADMIYNNGLYLLTMEQDSINQSVYDEETGEFVLSDAPFVNEINIKTAYDPGYSPSYKKNIVLNYANADKKEESTVKLVRENDKITVKTDRYTLETGISNCQTVMSDESRLILLQAENSYNVLHTFDFEKMEKYTTDLSMQGNTVTAYPMGKNVLIYYDYVQRNMFFIPELGAGFNLNDTDSYTYSFIDTMININIDTSLHVEQSMIGVSDNELAILNYETFISDFYYFIYEESSMLDICSNYTPSKNNPLQKLYIFEAE